MAVPEIIPKLNVLTETGALIAEFSNISTSIKLSAFRNLLQSKKTLASSFVFLRKHAPVSHKQEEFVTLSRLIEDGKDAKAKFLYLRSTNPSASFTLVQSQPDKSKPSFKDEPSLPYSAEEIELSEGIEREKRTYWNKRFRHFAQDLYEKRRTKHEVYGIIDVEWVHKKSDLLKVMYDKAIRLLQEKDMESASQTLRSNVNIQSKFVRREMELIPKFDELCKAEFELKTCYQKIEDIHAKTHDCTVGNKSEQTKWSRNLKELEEAFDKHYTKLKQQQAALLKCLKGVDKATSMPLSKETHTDFDMKTTPDIDAEDVEKIADNIRNDYLVEEMSESD